LELNGSPVDSYSFSSLDPALAPALAEAALVQHLHDLQAILLLGIGDAPAANLLGLMALFPAANLGVVTQAIRIDLSDTRSLA